MSRIKEYFMKHYPNIFGDLEREHLFNDILAQEKDSTNYEEFKNSKDYIESDIVKQAKIQIGDERTIKVSTLKQKYTVDTKDEGVWL